MDLFELKKRIIKESLGITEDFGVIYTFIDFANVNHWYDNEHNYIDGLPLNKKGVLRIGIQKLKDFSDIFSSSIGFYYGHDSKNSGSLLFLTLTKKVFGRHNVFTKQIQRVRHYLEKDIMISNKRSVYRDKAGDFIFVPKCNFDVEICVDAVRKTGLYDTVCIFSGDADFVYLAQFLRRINKKVILVKNGYIHHSLHAIADLIIDSNNIKKYITIKTQKT